MIDLTGIVTDTHRLGFKLRDTWVNYSQYGYSGRDHSATPPVQPGQHITVEAVRSGSRLFINSRASALFARRITFWE